MAVIVLFKLVRRRFGILWDPISEARLAGLHPDIKRDVRRFINKAEDKGIKLRITSGFRSFNEQQTLYDQGRISTSIGDLLGTLSGSSQKIVTNAKPGQSYHNYGLAFDVVPIRDGEGVWNYADPVWKEIGLMGKGFGFGWGGDWSKPDYPHFEKKFGMSTGTLAKRAASEKTPYVSLAA